MAEKDKTNTAFWGPNKQLNERNVDSYELKNAPRFFQRIIDKTLRGVIYVKYYIDDINMWSMDLELQIGHLRAVMQKLNNKGSRVRQG